MAASPFVSVAQQAAVQAGIDPNIFVRQIHQESGFNPSAGSPAGALGIAQIVPHWHPDAPPASDPTGQLHWAAHYMAGLIHKYGSYEQALSVYNSGKPDAYKDPNFAKGETFNYVRNIIGGATPAISGPGVASRTAMQGRQQQLSVQQPQLKLMANPKSDLLDTIRSNLASIGGGGQAKSLTDMLVNSQMGANPLKMPSFNLPSIRPGALKTKQQAAAVTSPLDISKWVTVAPHANRPGVNLNPAVLDFVGGLGHAYGSPLTIGTGTNHNEYVVGTHRESAHWQGNAADIPSTGAQLTKLGQAALIHAGMSPKEAAKQTGGLFNVGGYQIIFNSNIGGNHYNHLHVGIRGSA